MDRGRVRQPGSEQRPTALCTAAAVPAPAGKAAGAGQESEFSVDEALQFSPPERQPDDAARSEARKRTDPNFPSVGVWMRRSKQDPEKLHGA